MIGAWSFLAAAVAVTLAIWHPAFLRRRWPLLVALAVMGFWLNQARSEFILAADATTYIAAAERLLAHGDIYHVHPGDRTVLWGEPWVPAPTLYPPTAALMAVPFAWLGDLGLWAAWLINGGLALWVTYDAYRRGLAVPTMALLPFVGVQVLVGNINGSIAAAAVLAWRRRDSVMAGALIGALGAFKVAPLAVLAFWAVSRRWKPLVGAVTTFGVLAGLTLVALGTRPFKEWVDLALAVPPSPVSIQALGVPTTMLVGIGLLALWWVRSREQSAYAVAVLLAMFAAPTFNLTTTTLFFGALAPFGGRDPDAPVPSESPRSRGLVDGPTSRPSQSAGAEGQRSRWEGQLD